MRPACDRAVRVALALVPLTFLACFFGWPVAAIIARGLSAQTRCGRS